MRWIKLLFCRLSAVVLPFLLVDYGYSSFFAYAVPEDPLRKPHPVYHHTLAANARTIETWGGNEHQVCTDRHGFKASCLHELPLGSQFDLAFMGDSVTEAIGLIYEDSFVGMFARAHPELRVANLGVSSYFPGIYLVKVKQLLEQGIGFDHLVVFIDISDMQDETQYFIDGKGHVHRRYDVHLLKKLAREHFQLSTTLYMTIRYRSLSYIDTATDPAFDPTIDPFTTPRAEWTYQPDSRHYGDMGVAGAIASAVSHMESLHELLRAHDILLSVGVHPWPAQLQYDNLADSRQSRIWRDFCRGRCAMYIDAFPAFSNIVSAANAESVHRDFYIAGDVHFNRRGNQLIFELLNSRYLTFKGNSSH